MEVGFLIPVLAIGTLGAVTVFALRSKAKTEAAKRDSDHDKSTLASDAPDNRAS